jgi:hypothetical protein
MKDALSNQAIRINDFYTIVKERHCVTLNYEKLGEPNLETGKRIKTSRQTYHGNIEQALNQFIDDSTVGHSVRELIQSLQNARADVKLLFNLLSNNNQ